VSLGARKGGDLAQRNVPVRALLEQGPSPASRPTRPWMPAAEMKATRVKMRVLQRPLGEKARTRPFHEDAGMAPERSTYRGRCCLARRGRRWPSLDLGVSRPGAALVTAGRGGKRRRARGCPVDCFEECRGSIALCRPCIRHLGRVGSGQLMIMMMLSIASAAPAGRMSRTFAMNFCTACLCGIAPMGREVAH